MFKKLNVLYTNELVLVDNDAPEEVLSGRWYLSDKGYVSGFIDGFGVRLHRYLMGLEKSDRRVVDHINGNPMDNRKINLRVCTRRQNSFNTKLSSNNKTGFKGVTISPAMFVATISTNGKAIFLGRFSKIEDAARAYDKAAKELHGEFARLNFPNEAA